MMSNSDNYTRLNSYYLISRHYHRRNWLSLFYFLIDVVVTNVYILYKLDNKDRKFLHIQFQKEVIRSLFRELETILRQRRPRSSKVIYHLRTRPVSKDSYKRHSWVKEDSYRRCKSYNLSRKADRLRKALQELSINVPNSTRRSKQDIHYTKWSCNKCNISICYNSRC